jgi:two-component system, chemotaxis family, sensor kinase CheA
VEMLAEPLLPPVQDSAPAASTPAQPTPPTATPPGAAPQGPDEETLIRLHNILDAQTAILALPDTGAWLPGRIKAVAQTLEACLAHLGAEVPGLEDALAASLDMRSGRPLLSWLVAYREPRDASDIPPAAPLPRATGILPPRPSSGRGDETAPTSDGENRRPAATAATRQEDNPANKVLKVDQAKVDRLMNLIGEMVVAKNSLPYLANRAENQFGVRELARDIKAQYAVINRIAEEMQDAIMQVRMMPVSFVFQRFPRLVRDISRKLGKEVELVLEGEETEADKNIVEALADPLIHIVRNSLDHGLELPEQRAAIGKPRTGKLLIRAAQESDRVMIEIIDDGRGIDPKIIKRKAYERNIIDEHQLERISDQDAINLVKPFPTSPDAASAWMSCVAPSTGWVAPWISRARQVGAPPCAFPCPCPWLSPM